MAVGKFGSIIFGKEKTVRHGYMGHAHVRQSMSKRQCGFRAYILANNRFFRTADSFTGAGSGVTSFVGTGAGTGSGPFTGTGTGAGTDSFAETGADSGAGGISV